MTYGDLPDTNDQSQPVVKKPEPPDDFPDAESFLKHIREQVALDEAADKDNRMAGLEDSKFFAGDQWPDYERTKRIDAKKPVITENFLPAFVAQILGNGRLNETEIKVLPDNGGTKAGATIREGIIRNIQKNSVAKIAYDKAAENQVICGIGNFRLVLEEAEDDVFKQDMKIEAIPHPFAVVWDRMSVDPTGADAGHVTVGDIMPSDIFAKTWPWATAADLMLADSDLYANGWVTQETVRIAAFWRMRSRKRTFAMLVDGTVKDVTGTDPSQLQLATFEDGTPAIREGNCKYAEMYLVSGMDLLAGPYVLPISSVPVFRVEGWNINVGLRRERWGLVRFLKDPQRLHNYWRATIAEKLTQIPKANWIARLSAVMGRQKEWQNSHLSDNPLLIFNDEAAEAPVRVPATPLEPALITESETTKQVLKDISNIHEASLGQQSNEVSGKAIVARQRVGELGSVIYQDNQDLAKERCGRVINELIPYVYDRTRIIKILGPDDKAALQEINNPNNPDSDVTIGKYAITSTTGPSYVTKRVEAQESMLALFNAAPQTFAPAIPQIVREMDWPGAEDIAKALTPPNAIPPDEMTPEQKQQAQVAAQLQAKVAQIQIDTAQAALDKAQAEVAEVRAKTALLMAQAAAVPDNVRIKAAAEDQKSRSAQLADHLAAIEVAEGTGKEQTNVSG